MKLYEYRILFVPSEKKDKKQAEKPEVIAKGELFAADQKQVDVLCARMIPEKFIDRLTEVVIATRPF